jgi:hypothetical protein
VALTAARRTCAFDDTPRLFPMTNTVKSVLWAFVGPLVSCYAGYIAFVILGLILGPGFDIDAEVTPIQEFFGLAALWAFGIVAGGGTLLSLWIAVATFRRR